MGSGYENIPEEKEDIFYLFGKPKRNEPQWQITDDTQLTIATIEAMLEDNFTPAYLAQQFLALYKKRVLKGLGASTLKALRELEVGGHGSQVGRRGEYAAGNGAAMRIAPLAFHTGIEKETIREISYLTHHNDEAYVGAWSIIIAIRSILDGCTNNKQILETIISKLPDTRVRDRFIEIKEIKDIETVGALGNDGYVVNSVPLAIFAGLKVKEFGLEKIYRTLIDIGGDTDTNCSIAGQIAGTIIGKKGIPIELLKKLEQLTEFEWIQKTMYKTFKNLNQNKVK